jgi:hypothetical protein
MSNKTFPLDESRSRSIPRKEQSNCQKVFNILYKSAIILGITVLVVNQGHPIVQ